MIHVGRRSSRSTSKSAEKASRRAPPLCYERRTIHDQVCALILKPKMRLAHSSVVRKGTLLIRYLQTGIAFV
jgi:hypothetical protein